MNLSKLIPISESLHFIGLRKSATYDLIKAGQLQAVKIGKRTFLDEAEIARFLSENARLIGRQDHPPQKAA
jgi:predicted DNA-binding transcriptional regulator AlpA